MLSAEIITIGDEILYGQIVDTNSQWMGEHLAAHGIKVARKMSIGDTKEAIIGALQAVLPNTKLVLITGGLGPTKDDITKKTLAEFFGVDMTVRQEVMAHLERIFAQKGRELTELNRMQADIPANAKVLHNEVGTAPGMWFEDQGRIFISMPGVPHEMKYLMTHEALPRIKAQFEMPHIYHRMVRISGVPESKLAKILEHWEASLGDEIGLAYLPRFTDVKLRLTSSGYDLEKLKAASQEKIEQLKPLIGDHVMDWWGQDVELTLGDFLKQHGKTVATAESCTGGLLSHFLTKNAGSSAFYRGGIVAYANEVKEQQLGVSPELLQAHGAVSEQVAMAMAKGVRQRLGTDFGISTTGVAGPGGAVPNKPVGTVWIGYSSEHQTSARLLNISGDRTINIKYATMAVLNYFLKNAREETHQIATEAV